MNILSIQSVFFFFLYPILLEQQYVHVPFFMEKIIQVVRKMNLSVKEY